MTYKELRNEVQERYNTLFEACGVFWAFSVEQFKAQAPTGVKLVSIGMGGYMPKSEYGKLTEGLADIKKYEQSMQKKIVPADAILYELRNYECFYTGDIDDAVKALSPLGYTYDQVQEVYRQHYDAETASI